MKICKAWFVVALAGVVGCSTATTPAAAGDNAATVKLADVALDLNLTLDTTDARAIVAAKLPDDKPGNGGDWKCRLIHSDPETEPFAEFVRHVDPGALLVLVNLTGDPLTFKFGGQLFVEKGFSFTLENEEIKILKVKEGISVPADSSAAPLELDAPCFETLPGPIVPIP